MRCWTSHEDLKSLSLASKSFPFRDCLRLSVAVNCRKNGINPKFSTHLKASFQDMQILLFLKFAP